jgi:group I intron endonuclease
MIVYKAENLINKKVYIGRTVCPIEDRQWGHVNAAKKNSKTVFHNAIRKHGADNFQFSVLCQCDSYEEMNEKEKYFISLLDSQIPNGYNMTPGGDGLPKGWKSPMKGIHFLSDEAKEKISKSLMGKKQSEETRKKRSESLKQAYREGRRISWNKGLTKETNASVKVQGSNGHVAWNKGLKGFLKGRVAWNKGLTKATDSRLIKQAEKITGNVAWNKGLTKDTDMRVKQYSDSLSNSLSSGVFKKGQKPWNKGLKMVHSEESNQKRSVTLKGKKKPAETIVRMKIAQIERRLKEKLVVNR